MPKHNLSNIQDKYYSPDTNWADTICPNPECGSSDIGLEKVEFPDSFIEYQYKCGQCGKTFL